ncbi:MAG: hypothetical protein IJE07_10045 [Clostridia bacterium]|nr:hypothetical protein [Clostridia bacterium]
MKANKLKNQEELNMWQPTSDLMSALMYILMLIVLLLGLYLLQIPETDEVDPYPGDHYDGEGWHEDGGLTPTPSATPTPTPDWDDGGGGGWYNDGGWPSPTVTVTLTPTPTITPTWRPDNGTGGGGGGGNGGGDGPGEEPDNGFKSAVYVMLIDAETERTIKVADVQFELYSMDGALQILNTYYPEKLTYRSFQTTESGTFYLPEKLMAGTYELHQLTEPAGYDAAPNQVFALEDLYDWPDPYVVRVPVYPCRNIIRVQQTDTETGLPVPGGSYDVISVSNVITADGTLRYRAGETVATIECDENGYGESPEIYLGEYRVVQSAIPAYYAAQTAAFTTTVNRKDDGTPPVNAVLCDRTRVTLTLADELYPARGIAGATFTVTSDAPGAAPAEVTTDAHGRIVLDALDKGVTYRIVQRSTTGRYRADADVHTVAVTADGFIGSAPQAEISVVNRVLRVSLGVTDELSSVQVPGVSLALYNSSDELMTTWTSTSSGLLLETLSEGSYYIVKDGDTEKHYPFTVRDEAKIQTFNVHTTYVLQYVLLGAGALAVTGGGVGAAVLLRRRKRKATQN